MSSIHTVSMFDDRGGTPPLRPLTPVEMRVLGSLLEKQQTTPEYYPLTVNALIAACNQKSNREPVMELSEQDVVDALESLAFERIVRQVSGARAARWEHLLDYRLGLDRAWKAVLTLLLLRGAQTPGELRTRSERLHPFASVSEVEEALASMAERSTPLARDLGRRPGQKEPRWIHLLGDVPPPAAATETPPGEQRESSEARLQRLEQSLEALWDELRELKRGLGG